MEHCVSLQNRVSQSQRYWCLGPGNSVLWRGVLYIVGYLAALPSPYPRHASSTTTPAVITTDKGSRYCPMFPGGQNQPWLRNTAPIKKQIYIHWHIISGNWKIQKTLTFIHRYIYICVYICKMNGWKSLLHRVLVEDIYIYTHTHTHI